MDLLEYLINYGDGISWLCGGRAAAEWAGTDKGQHNEDKLTSDNDGKDTAQ
jgi:hypothetical protein